MFYMGSSSFISIVNTKTRKWFWQSSDAPKALQELAMKTRPIILKRWTVNDSKMTRLVPGTCLHQPLIRQILAVKEWASMKSQVLELMANISRNTWRSRKAITGKFECFKMHSCHFNRGLLCHRVRLLHHLPGKSLETKYLRACIELDFDILPWSTTRRTNWWLRLMRNGQTRRKYI